ncbi:MAG: helix-turn-helix transcriptional regulator [Clostridia bacterium]|nr:helix-turn-helix transcriptional regulator [Clostridia bacterium]
MSKFSDVLTLLRKEENLSQHDLARNLGLTRSAVSMYETGQREPDFETLEIFADYFNVDMDYLTGRSDVRLRTPILDEVKYFGAKLRTLRYRNRLTQEALADAVGLSKSTICLYEGGKREPSFDVLQKLSSFFDIEIGGFFPPKEEKLAAFGNELFEKFSKLSAKNQALVRSTMLSMIEQLLNAQSEQ